MKHALSNYGRTSASQLIRPIVLAGIAPLLIVGYSVRPAIDYGRMASAIEQAEDRAGRASRVREFLGEFEAGAPPTERLRAVERALAERIPSRFEATKFYRDCLAAIRHFDMRLESIAPFRSEDLGLMVGALSIHEHVVLLKGRGRAADIEPFLAALHREGRPVSARDCKLLSVEGERGVFDFQLELGVFHLSPPSSSESDDEYDEDA